MTTLQRNRRKVRLFHWLMRLANRIAALPNRVTPPPFRLIQMGSAFWQSRALYVAARLGIADALMDEERSTRELADTLHVHEDHLYRLMRMLASLGVFAETAPRVFRNSKLSSCLREDSGQGVRALILMHNSPVMTRPWLESLEDCVRNGGTPFVEVHGVEFYEYMNRHEDFDALFSRAMDAVESLTGDTWLEDFDWSRFDRLVDVGGSKGSKSVAVLRANPHLRALVFDRPQVVEGAAAYWCDRIPPALFERIEFVGGDMFDAIPAPRSDRDLYMFVAVFHGLDDAAAHRLLERLGTAFGGRRPTVLIVETIAAPTGTDPMVAAFDMQMLVNTRGRERTREEWEALAGRAGFAIVEVVDVRTFAGFIVLRPR